MTDNNNRNSRSAETRETQTRRKPWQPPSMLDAPKAPAGYKFRWIRESVRGQDDKSNMSNGSRSGVIGVGGLILAKVPLETAEERNAYFQQQTSEQLNGVDHNYLRESDPKMPLKNSDIQRTSKVQFGSRPNESTD